ncbi:helix-turn-helix domain-containing protein [Kitasatospora putterlickiae]
MTPSPPDRPRIGHAPPAPALRAFVERYWWCEGGAGALPRLLPGTGAELWTHWAGGVVPRAADTAADTAGGTGAPTPLPAAHLVCLRRAAWRLERRAGASGFLAVRFRAGALRHLVPFGLDELADRVVAAEDLWGASGRRLVEQVRAAGGPAQRLALMDSFLTGRLAEHHRPEPWLEAAVGRVYRRPNGLRIDRLAASTGVGTRRLQRAFPAAVGARPKEFQRLARFQRLTRRLLLEDQRDYLPAALAAGYYDQAHFVHEFRRLTGERPTALLGRGLSHFSYPPLTLGGDAARELPRRTETP